MNNEKVTCQSCGKEWISGVCNKYFECIYCGYVSETHRVKFDIVEVEKEKPL